MIQETENTWRTGKLRNEELHTLYSSPNIIKFMTAVKIRWVRHAVGMREMRNAYIVDRIPDRYRSVINTGAEESTA
jgi:hypothetical protein